MGSLAGTRLNEEFKKRLVLVFSCIAMGIGVYMTGKIVALPPVVLSILLGSICGEILRLEPAFTSLAARLAKLCGNRVTKDPDHGKAIQEQFTVMAVIFCASSLGFFGSLREGLTGDPSLLFIKACIDLPTAMVVAASIGGVIGFLAVPQCAVQLLALLTAGLFAHMTTPAMLHDFSGAGGIIMLAAGLRQCGLMQFPVISMMPALILVMPLSAMWTRYMG